MGATLTTVNDVTKEVYTGRIVTQLQDEEVAMKRMERTSDGVTAHAGGKYVVFPLRIKRNSGLGYRNENEALQDAGQQGYTSVRVSLRYGYGRLHLSGPVMELASSDFQSFANILDDEMSGLKDDLTKDQNRIIYGDGMGTVATVTAKAANTVTVDDVRFFQDDEVIDVVAAADGTVHAQKRMVTAIDEDTNTVTYDGVDATATIVVGDLVVRTGNYGREPNGFESIVDNAGEIYNVDPATVPIWKSIINDNGGVNRALSEGLMIKTTDDIRRKGGKTSLILCGLGVRRAYFNLLSQQRRYVNTKEFAGGLTGLAFNNGREIPVVEDVDAPPNEMEFIQEDTFKIYQARDWSFLNLDGDIWKWVVGYDAWESVMAKYWEVGCSRRNANGKLKDLTEG